MYWRKAVTTGSISAAALASRAYSAPPGRVSGLGEADGELLVAVLDLPELIEHDPRSGPGDGAPGPGPAPRAAATLLAPYFFWKRSMRPAVSTSFCLPVKNGWTL